MASSPTSKKDPTKAIYSALLEELATPSILYSSKRSYIFKRPKNGMVGILSMPERI